MLHKRIVCPNACGDEFITTAHVMQDWKVDGTGNFIETANNCLEVTHAPSDGNLWTCAVCGSEAAALDDSEYAGSFEYGGYHFKPYRKFEETENNRQLENDSREWKNDVQFAMRNMRSSFALGISRYSWGKCSYSYEDFYEKSGGSDADIFQCVENGKIYVPAENELFEYTKP